MQIGGFAIHVGAHIEHQHRLPGILGREQSSDGRPINPRQATQPEDR